jgi:transposase
MHVEPHGTCAELDRRIRNASDQPKLRQRLRAIRLALDQLTAEEVGRRVGLSRRQVQTWVQRFNAAGWQGLEDFPGRGQPLPLAPDEQARLGERLAAGPRPEDGVCTLRGEDIRRILEQEFGVCRKLSSVYYLLHRLGFSSLVPRPRHPRTDPSRQEAFKKKNCPSNSRRFRSSTLPKSSASSSRTRPASDSKAR